MLSNRSFEKFDSTTSSWNWKELTIFYAYKRFSAVPEDFSIVPNCMMNKTLILQQAIGSVAIVKYCGSRLQSGGNTNF